MKDLLDQLWGGASIWELNIPSSLCIDKTTLDMTLLQTFSYASSLEIFNSINDRENAVDRVAAIVTAVYNPYIQWASKKPMDSKINEFIAVSATINQGTLNSANYSFEVKQTCAHPPKSEFTIIGPTFKIWSTGGLTPSFSLGANSMSVNFSTKVHMETHGLDSDVIKHRLEWDYPGFKTENIIPLYPFTRNTGFCGGILVSDIDSKTQFVGSIKSLTITGLIDGKRVLGKIKDGIYYIEPSDGEVWAYSLDDDPLGPRIVVAENVLADPMVISW